MQYLVSVVYLTAGSVAPVLERPANVSFSIHTLPCVPIIMSTKKSEPFRYSEDIRLKNSAADAPMQKRQAALRKKHKHILCSVLQSPGLKSDILHENSPAHRRQPFASSHIIGRNAPFCCSHASYIIHYPAAICKHLRQILAIEFLSNLPPRFGHFVQSRKTAHRSAQNPPFIY